MIRSATASVLPRLAAAILALAALPAPGHAITAASPVPAGEAATDPAASATADDTPAPGRRRVMPTLNYQKGDITLSNGLAHLKVPDTFRFLDAADARKVVVDVWGNPPEVGRSVIGMLLPAGMGPQEGSSWGVVISYEDDGYVKDDDASKIDYTSMLKTMQEATHKENEAREKAGYPSMELVGWGRTPAVRRRQQEVILGEGTANRRFGRAHTQL